MLYWALFNRSDCGLEDFLWIVRACCCKTEPDQTSQDNKHVGWSAAVFVHVFVGFFVILCVTCAGGSVFTYLKGSVFMRASVSLYLLHIEYQNSSFYHQSEDIFSILTGSHKWLFDGWDMVLGGLELGLV